MEDREPVSLPRLMTALFGNILASDSVVMIRTFKDTSQLESINPNIVNETCALHIESRVAEGNVRFN